MEILSFFFLTDSILFTICLGLAIISSMMSIMGVESDDYADEFDIEAGNVPGVLSWLGFGKAPLLILLTSFFLFFGVFGLSLQFLFQGLGLTMFWWVVSLIVLFPSLLLTKIVGQSFAKHLPNIENYAHSAKDLVGLTALVTLPNLHQGDACEAKIDIPNKSTQYVRIRVRDIKSVGDVVTIGSYDPITFEYHEK